MVFALLPFVLPRIGSTVSLGTEIVLYTLYGIGYNLLLGYTGLVSFGPSAYFGIAAYGAGLAQLHLASNIYVAVVLGDADSPPSRAWRWARLFCGAAACTSPFSRWRSRSCFTKSPSSGLR